MNFDDTPEQRELRLAARAWLTEHAPPLTADAVDTADTPESIAAGREWQRLKYDSGWGGLAWPREFGGQGRPMIDQIVWDQEAAAFAVPEETFIVSNMLAGPTIIDLGTPEQQAEHLPPILDGRAIWSQLFSEPDAGSDLAGVTTTGVLDGDVWRVTGQKVWSSGAHYADFGLLLVRTDRSAPKHRGMSYFLLDMTLPGIEVRPIRQITGPEHFNEVFLDDVRIPASAMLGAPGDGWKAALATLAHERVGLSLRRRVDIGSFLELVGGARVGDVPARELDDVRQEVARLWMRAEAIRLVGLRTMTSIARGETPGPEGSAAKLAGADLINRAGRMALDLLGADGLDAADPVAARWHTAYLDAVARRIAGGTDEIQRTIIAERVLGMPKEPTVGEGPAAMPKAGASR